MQITRQQLRTAVASGLHASPALPEPFRTRVTELAANAHVIGTNYATEPVGCPMTVVGAYVDNGPTQEPTIAPGVSSFVCAFDCSLLSIQAKTDYWGIYPDQIQVIG